MAFTQLPAHVPAKALLSFFAIHGQKKALISSDG